MEERFCAKSGSDPNSLALNLNSSRMRSTLENTISPLLNRNEKALISVQGVFRHLIGNGENSDFWRDNWTDKRELKEFPRIFVLALAKEGTIAKFG